MRKTLTLDDSIAREIEKRAAEAGKPFGAVVNETLERGLARKLPPKRYRLKPVSLGGPCEGVDLTKALALAGDLDDRERARQLARRR